MPLQKSQIKFQKLLKPGTFYYKDLVKALEEAIEEGVLELRAVEIEEGRLDT